MASLPQGAAFTTALRSWLATGSGRAFQKDVGFVDGQVKFARIEFKMTMPRLQPSFKVDMPMCMAVLRGVACSGV